MQQREIVVFERDERHTENDKPELDFRLIRGALPTGACPLAIADRDGFTIHCGQWFDSAEVAAFAEEKSGFASEVQL